MILVSGFNAQCYQLKDMHGNGEKQRKLHVISSRLVCDPSGRVVALTSPLDPRGVSGGAGSGGVVGWGYTSKPEQTTPEIE